MRKFYGWLALSGLVIFLDQASKLFVLATLAPYESRYFLPFFNWVLAFNPGASFSFLAGAGGWQRHFLTALALAVSVWIVLMLKKEADKPKTAFAFSFILGGALGNVIDRIRLGAVVDFIEWHYAGFHWPAFNLADSAIFLGVVVMLWDIFSQAQKPKSKNHTRVEQN